MPGDFDEAKFSWKNYKKELEVWAKFTKLSEDKRGPALWCSLTGKAKEAIQDMDIAEISAVDGLDKIITKLDSLFKIDENQAAYLAYQEFETYKRSTDVSLQDFLVKFEALHAKIKRHGMTLSEGVLAYRFLHSANLSNEEMSLCRATITAFKYEDMKKKVMSLFGDKTVIKKSAEDVFYGSNSTYQNVQRGYQGRGRRGGRGRGVYRGRGNDNPYQSGKLNPPGKFGSPSTCANCGSRYHWVKDCPDKPDIRKKTDQAINFCEDFSEAVNVETILLQNSEKMLQHFLGETIGCAVIDSGCSKTVSGKQWVQCYLQQLNTGEKHEMFLNNSSNSFRFGKGSPVLSCGKIKLPAKIGSKNVMIETDVVDVEIPMLLSKESLKMAGAVLDFNHDTAIMFGEKQTLIATESGHYAIPLNPGVDSMRMEEHITMINTTHNKSPFVATTAAQKLHRQFGHCSAERLTRLIKSSKLWNAENEKALIKEVERVSSVCEICRKYKKTPASPVACLPLANEFNEVVAMDLIVFTHGKYILHLIDMFTRYSVACVRGSKRQSHIVDAIMKIWVSYFGCPKRFLADNGGEFANTEYREMCENLGVDMMKTAAESPWSNGLCERHNAVIKVSVLKTMEETKCSMETATAWAVSAKNSLHGHLGYSPNTLVFGKNPNFPSVITDKPPAMAADYASMTVENNLRAMRTARENFLKSESSDRIWRALRHNIRTSCESNFQNGDQVYFKRDDSRRWHGPAKVLDQEGKQIILRYDNQIVRVHVSRVTYTANQNAGDMRKDDITGDGEMKQSQEQECSFPILSMAFMDEDANNDENQQGVAVTNPTSPLVTVETAETVMSPTTAETNSTTTETVEIDDYPTKTADNANDVDFGLNTAFITENQEVSVEMHSNMSQEAAINPEITQEDDEPLSNIRLRIIEKEAAKRTDIGIADMPSKVLPKVK